MNEENKEAEIQEVNLEMIGTLDLIDAKISHAFTIIKLYQELPENLKYGRFEDLQDRAAGLLESALDYLEQL